MISPKEGGCWLSYQSTADKVCAQVGYREGSPERMGMGGRRVEQEAACSVVPVACYNNNLGAGGLGYNESCAGPDSFINSLAGYVTSAWAIHVCLDEIFHTGTPNTLLQHLLYMRPRFVFLIPLSGLRPVPH